MQNEKKKKSLTDFTKKLDGGEIKIVTGNQLMREVIDNLNKRNDKDRRNLLDRGAEAIRKREINNRNLIK